MPSLRLRPFLQLNRFDPTAGLRRLLPSAAKGSLKYFMTTFVSYTNRLQTYQQLNTADQLFSSNGFLKLVMQGDGNFVLYRTQFGRALWASNTAGEPLTHVVMQADGNLVGASVEGTVYWATGTQGHPGAWAELQDDGNFVIYGAAGNAVWATNTVQDFNSPTFQYVDGPGYQCDETSERWKQLCTAFPCFALLQWPGYATQVVESAIDGQPVVIQLWKGTCQKFLGLSDFPGGIGGEVGVYHRMPGRTRPTLDSLSFLPAEFAAFIVVSIAALTDDQLWWAFPELNTRVSLALTNPVTSRILLAAGTESTYWLNKWMDDDSYEKYQSDQGEQTPRSPTDYLLDYNINGVAFPRW